LKLKSRRAGDNWSNPSDKEKNKELSKRFHDAIKKSKDIDISAEERESDVSEADYFRKDYFREALT
jgi:hypothetical protein